MPSSKRSIVAGGNEYVNEALYELGKSYVAMKDMKRALQSFSKLLALAKRIPDVEGVCSAHMELAFTYKVNSSNCLSIFIAGRVLKSCTRSNWTTTLIPRNICDCFARTLRNFVSFKSSPTRTTTPVNTI